MSALNKKLASEYAEHGIITDLSRLLRSRHWAQHLKLFSRQAARSMLLGNVRSRFRGRGMEFEEVRRYQAGDGSEKQFKSVLAAELATGLSWAALAGGDRVGGQVIGDFAERDSRGRRSKQAVLHFIHDINEFNQALMQPELLDEENKPDQPSSLANSLEECQRITRPGTAIFIISDFHDFDAGAAKALSNLGKQADVSLLHVVDKLEQELPFNGSIAISDGEQKSHVQVSKNVKPKRVRFIKRCTPRKVHAMC